MLVKVYAAALQGINAIQVTIEVNALRGNRVLYVRDGQIFGECDLGKYEEDNAEREARLNSFLTEMGW